MSWTLLDPSRPEFPDPDTAAKEPNGLLALGGELSTALLLDAYKKGIFPWYDRQSPVMWWSPDPREVVLPGMQHWSKSMRKMARDTELKISTDKAFDSVIRACARQEDSNHWITDDMIAAYTELHNLGVAHSIEVWQKNQLVGGLYGIAIGAVFCGESMFHRVNNASKLAYLCMADRLFEQGFGLIDCQFETPHLRSLGSCAIPRNQYLQKIRDSSHCEIEWPHTFAPDLR